MKLFLSTLLLFCCATAFTQYTAPRLEVYVAPGLFSEKLSNDELIPPERRNDARLGDVVSFGAQYAMPLKNKRFTVKGGLAFGQRHYSLNKYSIGDFITILFLFDSPYGDTFNISYARFTNNYLQVPLSFSYTLTRPKHNFQLAVGLNLRSDFLISRNVKVIFDSIYNTPQANDIVAAKKLYTRNASTYVFSADPFVEASFSVQKQIGLLFQFRPFSWYTSPLDKRLTTSTVDFFGFTFGAFYSFK